MCAIVGIYGNDNAARLASIALFAMQHRGQEATGISSSCNGKIHTIKNKPCAKRHTYINYIKIMTKCKNQ